MDILSLGVTSLSQSLVLALGDLPAWGNALLVIAASAAIAISANWIVGSACRIGSRIGVSTTVMGLTVVALGTSAPEFAVTLLAAFEGRGDISVANVVGSNIFNLGFILGGVALIRPIPTSSTLIRRDGSVLIATTFLLLALVAFDLRLGRGDGLVLFSLVIVYVWVLLRYSRPSVSKVEKAGKPTFDYGAYRPLLRDASQLLAGMVLISAAAHVLVNAASVLAVGFGVSEWVVGVTVVAAGTSAPEFATAMTGVLRKQYGLSLGNIIGSDIFNMLGVLGLAGILRGMQVDEAARASLAALSLMVVIVVILMRSDWQLSRQEGFLLVALALLRWGLDFGT